jgi:hypothetical protein
MLVWTLLIDTDADWPLVATIVSDTEPSRVMVAAIVEYRLSEVNIKQSPFNLDDWTYTLIANGTFE